MGPGAGGDAAPTTHSHAPRRVARKQAPLWQNGCAEAGGAWRLDEAWRQLAIGRELETVRTGRPVHLEPVLQLANIGPARAPARRAPLAGRSAPRLWAYLQCKAVQSENGRVWQIWAPGAAAVSIVEAPRGAKFGQTEAAQTRAGPQPVCSDACWWGTACGGASCHVHLRSVIIITCHDMSSTHHSANGMYTCIARDLESRSSPIPQRRTFCHATLHARPVTFATFAVHVGSRAPGRIRSDRPPAAVTSTCAFDTASARVARHPSRCDPQVHIRSNGWTYWAGERLLKVEAQPRPQHVVRHVDGWQERAPQVPTARQKLCP
jgi:hypothetical protein